MFDDPYREAPLVDRDLTGQGWEDWSIEFLVPGTVARRAGVDSWPKAASRVIN